MRLPSSALIRRPDLFLFLALALPLAAQGRLDLRIEVDRTGLHELRYEAFESTVEGASLDPERMTLLDREGREVPVQLRGLRGDRFGPRASLVFWAEAPDGPHTKKGVYRLTYGRGSPRIGEIETRPEAAPRTEAMVSRHFEEDLLFDAWETTRPELLDGAGSARPHWFWDRVPAPRGNDAPPDLRSFALDLREMKPLHAETLRARLVLRVRTALGPGARPRLAVDVSGREIARLDVSGGPLVDLEVSVPSSELAAVTLIGLRNLSTQARVPQPGNSVRPEVPNDLLLDSIELTWPAVLLGPNGKSRQIRYEVAPTQDAHDYGFVGLAKEPYQVFDPAAQAFVKDHVAHQEAGRKLDVVVCANDGYHAPSLVVPWSKRRLLAETEGGDWVVVTQPRFLPALEPLAAQRRSQGLSPFIATDREIYDEYSGGAFDPGAIGLFLTDARERWKKKPRWLLLVGDADRDVDWSNENPGLPCALVDTLYNGASASDQALVPPAAGNLAVGRLPFRREDDLLTFVSRLIRYENAPEPGSWRRRLDFVVSEGRFGPMIDPLIERFGMAVIADQVPGAFDVGVLFASPRSPYFYPPAQIEEKVVSAINAGSLAFTYIGHGYTRGFDQVRIGKLRFPILLDRDLDRIDSGRRPTILTIVACSTAEFDDPAEDGFGERILRRPGGPIAVIGATRISHPLPNALLGRELAGAFFDPSRSTLGEMLAGAKERMLAGWKGDPISLLASAFTTGIDMARLFDDHRHLYVLLGDPATRVARPDDSIMIEAPDSANPGAEITISGRVEGKDGLVVGLALTAPRDRLLHPLSPVEEPASAAAAPRIAENHRLANDKTVWSGRGELKGGTFSATCVLPAELRPGRYTLVAVLEDGSRLSIGDRVLSVESP